MATTVFISHAAADLELVRKVEAHSKPLDIVTYAYEDDPQGGSAVADKLLDRIKDADVVVVLLTKQSELRPSVHAEVGAARSLGKTIIPVVEQGVDPSKFVFLQGLEWIALDTSKVDNTLLHLQLSLKRIKNAAEQNAATIGVVLLVLGLLFLFVASTKKTQS